MDPSEEKAALENLAKRLGAGEASKEEIAKAEKLGIEPKKPKAKAK